MGQNSVFNKLNCNNLRFPLIEKIRPFPQEKKCEISPISRGWSFFKMNPRVFKSQRVNVNTLILSNFEYVLL